MLFMGTEKFPNEDGYGEYLAQHGGYSNAYTSSTNTNYYFEVGAPHLRGALDMCVHQVDLALMRAGSLNFLLRRFLRRIPLLEKLTP
jgi:insulysin